MPPKAKRAPAPPRGPRKSLNEGEEFTGELIDETNGRSYAVTNQGRVLVRHKVRFSITPTEAGKKFFEDHVVEIIPKIPILIVALAEGGSPYPRSSYLPLNSKVFRDQGDAIHGRSRIAGRSKMEYVRQQTRERVDNWLAGRPTVAETLGDEGIERFGLQEYREHKVCAQLYESLWLYDSGRPILEDDRTTWVKRDNTLDVA